MYTRRYISKFQVSRKMFERYFLYCTLHKAYFETLIGHVEFLFLLCERRRDWIWFMFVKSYICACKKRASRGNQRLLVDCFHHPNQRKFAYIEVRVPNTWRYLYFSRNCVWKRFFGVYFASWITRDFYNIYSNWITFLASQFSKKICLL